MAGLYYGMPGKRIGVFSARQDAEARGSFYFASLAFDYDRRDINSQKKLIRQRFANTEWQVPKLLTLMDNAPDFYFDSVSQIKIDHWSRGRAVLLGDAACCASPMSGMGTSMAVVGAYILAGELRAVAGDHTVAFASYEQQMRGFATAAQKLAEGAEWFVPQTRFKHWMSLQIWKILPYTPWKNMMIEIVSKEVANTVEFETLLEKGGEKTQRMHPLSIAILFPQVLLKEQAGRAKTCVERDGGDAFLWRLLHHFIHHL